MLVLTITQAVGIARETHVTDQLAGSWHFVLLINTNEYGYFNTFIIGCFYVGTSSNITILVKDAQSNVTVLCFWRIMSMTSLAEMYS